VAKSGGNRSRLLLVLLLVSSLFLITLDLRGVNLASGIRGTVASIFSPVEKLFSTIFSPVGNFVGDLRNIGQSNEKIEDLTKEIDRLKSKEILDEDTKSVSSTSSIVLLMSDPTFKIGVRIAGTQSIGVLSGQGGNTYLLQLLDATGDIKVGDKLVARGSEGGRPFVPGVPVGSVIEVQSNSSSITQNADVEASANLNRIGIVAVVVAPPKSDPRDALIPKPNPTVTVYVTPTPTPSPSN